MTTRTPDDQAGGKPNRPRLPTFGADLLTELFVNPLDPGYVDAADQRARRGPPSRLRRVAGRGSTAVVLVVFGLLLSVAYQHVVAGAPEAARTRAKLVDEVTRSRDESTSLERRAARLRDEVAAERDRALGGGSEAERLRNMEAATGLATVTGPGITLTLTDGPRETDPVTGEPAEEQLGRVLDRDLQRVANALWASGAEAISIDGQRLSAVSTIRAAGEAILVDFTPVASPYRVQAVGPPSLRQRFDGTRTADQLRWLQDEYQMGFSIRGEDELTLEPAPDPQLRHAKPPGTASPSPTGGN